MRKLAQHGTHVLLLSCAFTGCGRARQAHDAANDGDDNHPRSGSGGWLLIPLAAAIALVATTAEAQQWNLALTSGAAAPIATDYVSAGYGVDLHASYLHSTDPGRFGVDITGGYTRFEGPARTLTGPSLWRFAAGPRYELGDRVRPGFFAHVGYGSFQQQLDEPSSDNDVQLIRDASLTGVALDAGAYLDWQAASLLTIGVFGSYNQIYAASGDDVRWMSAGLQVSLLFDQLHNRQRAR
jgi:hypothetical protein